MPEAGHRRQRAAVRRPLVALRPIRVDAPRPAAPRHRPLVARLPRRAAVLLPRVDRARATPAEKAAALARALQLVVRRTATAAQAVTRPVVRRMATAARQRGHPQRRQVETLWESAPPRQPRVRASCPTMALPIRTRVARAACQASVHRVVRSAGWGWQLLRYRYERADIITRRALQGFDVPRAAGFTRLPMSEYRRCQNIRRLCQ